jgi:hypothetical protein
MQEQRMLQKPTLHGQLIEDVQPLLEVDDLERVLAGYLDGRLGERDSGERAT